MAAIDGDISLQAHQPHQAHILETSRNLPEALNVTITKGVASVGCRERVHAPDREMTEKESGSLTVLVLHVRSDAAA